ncbi:hypothetical protein F0L68_20925 [Solihabitans fulvus]|uniref:Uncharacterized protein n=1 Tax=Solihabitans fulvus TaxID=1892852 RepID=A0A5B2X831_9PSEU|nr:hypothetical protein F0L68_20925 [Solihabitans fulvus]
MFHDTSRDARPFIFWSTARSPGKLTRERGTIDELPSGALRVRVYAGIDPASKRRHDLLARTLVAGPT